MGERTTKTLLIFNRNDLNGLKHIWNLIPFNMFDNVIAIDGQSTDGSYEFLVESGVYTYSQKTMGRGNAISEGMQLVDSDIVVELSSDGNEDPRSIPMLLHAMENGADLAIASRFASGGRTDDTDDPFRIRKLGNKFLTFLVNLLWGSNLTDSANGLRAFRMSAWKKMNIEASHFEAEFLMSIRAAKLKLCIAESPTIERSRVGGKVQARTTRVGFSLLRMVLKELLKGSRFVPSDCMSAN